MLRETGLRWLLVLMLGALVVMGQTGMAFAKSEVSLWVAWNSGALYEAIKARVDEFNNQQSDITVNMQSIADLREKLAVAMAGDSAPDMTMLDVIWIPEFLANGWLVPLDEIAPRGDHLVDAKDLYPGLQDVAVAGGRVWTVPDHVGTQPFMYNLDMFAEAGMADTAAPQTWSDIVSAGKRLTRDTDGDGTPNVWGLLLSVGAAEQTSNLWQSFLAQNGGQMLSSDRRQVTFHEAAGVGALEFWVDAMHTHGISAPIGAPQPAFTRRDVAMTIGPPANYRNSVRAGIATGVVPQPGQKARAATLGGFHFAVLRQEQSEAVYRFLSWYMQPERHAQTILDAGFAPTRRTEASARAMREAVTRDPLTSALVQQLEFVIARPPILRYADVSSVLWSWLVKGMKQEVSPRAALESAAREANAILAGK